MISQLPSRHALAWISFLLTANIALASAGTIKPGFPPYTVLEVRDDGNLLARHDGILSLTDSSGKILDWFQVPIRFSDWSINQPLVAVTDPSGAVFVGGLFPLNMGLPSVVKLQPDGSIDPEFVPITVASFSIPTFGFGLVISVVPDGNGGCFFSGDFDMIITEPENPYHLLRLGHADRFGTVSPVVDDASFLEPPVGNVPTKLFFDGSSLVFVTSSDVYRASMDGTVEPFFNDHSIEWAEAELGQNFSACYNPEFGIAIMGLGRSATVPELLRQCGVYRFDGTLKTEFQQRVGFADTAGVGDSLAWDYEGRLLVGAVTDGGTYIAGRADPWEGQLNPTPVSSDSAILEGFPQVIHTIKRLLPTGEIDCSWSKALWFEHPVFKLAVLPDGNVLAMDTTLACGFPTNGVTRLLSEPQNAQQPHQSVRSRIDASGEPVIMGVAIPGNSAREVLIRAVGPSLVRFGVSNPARGTRLTVFQRDTRIVSVGRFASTGPVRAVSGKLGAFPPDESTSNLEAQVLLQLLPGTYTILIELEPTLHSEPAGEAVLGEIYFN